MRNYMLSKGYEVNTYMEELEWDDAREDGKWIIENALNHGWVFAFVSAGKIDWRGNTGFKVFKLDEDQNLWHEVSGLNDDWTLRTITNITAVGRKWGAMVSSHDVPTGGMRAVTFMNGKQIYDRLRKEAGISRRDIIDHWDTYVYNTEHGDSPTNEQIYEAIEYADSDMIEDILMEAR